MNTHDILTLYKYNQWSNTRILNAAARVTPEEFLAPAPFPHGGLRGTLVHTLSAEWIWRSRWQGSSPTRLLQAVDFPDFASLRQRWHHEETQLMAFVESLTDEQLDKVFHYNNTSGKPFEQVLWHALAHVVNHGTQHRTEAAAMLTGFGHSPGDIDLIYFISEWR
jgi:uncharacterized damage-inducible protein DinB